MCIRIYKEPSEYQLSPEFEHCIFCDCQTNMWHEESNRPVCVTCAQLFDESEIKSAFFNYK